MAQIFAEAETKELILRDTELDSIVDLPLVHDADIMIRDDVETSPARYANLRTPPDKDINAETSPAREVNSGIPPAEEINAGIHPA